MALKSPRIAVRAVIVEDDRLLLVNAWPGGRSDLLCAPGGGVELGTSLSQNLIREVHEETGLKITVGPVCLVNEFHDPRSGFHQVEVFFRCAVPAGQSIDPQWKDPERVVDQHHWVTHEKLATLKVKPDALAEVAFAPQGNITYDPLESIVV